MLSLEEIRRAVLKACESLDCIYIVLFGSQAGGEAKAYSDVDLAVRFSGNRDVLGKALELAFRVEEDLGVHVDVVPVDVADSVLKYEVFSRGLLLYCRDRARYLDDHVNAVDEFLDFKPLFDRFYERVVREIRDAVSGCES